MYEFYALYAFPAILESVSYGCMEGWKVQVPSPAFIPIEYRADVRAVSERC